MTSRPPTCTAEEFGHRLVDTEPDPWWRYAFQTMFASVAQGRFAATTDDLSRLTGASPRTFEGALRLISAAAAAEQ